MELQQFTGPEQKCIDRKIPKLIEEGKKQDEAIAIAISTCAPSKSQNALKAMKNAMTFDPTSVLDRERIELDNRLPGGEYESFQNADGTWDIYDIPIIANRPVPLMSGEMFDITKEWEEIAVSKALLKWHRDKYAPPLRIRHERGFETRPTGKLLLKEVRIGMFEGEEAFVTFADFVAVPNDIYERIKRGELSYLSAEMNDISNHEINAVALLPDEEPFFRWAMINIGVENRLKEGVPVGQAMSLSRTELTVASRPFGARGVCLLSRFASVSLAGCEKGQTAEKTGCTPASGEGGGGTESFRKMEPQKQADALEGSANKLRDGKFTAGDVQALQTMFEETNLFDKVSDDHGQQIDDGIAELRQMIADEDPDQFKAAKNLASLIFEDVDNLVLSRKSKLQSNKETPEMADDDKKKKDDEAALRDAQEKELKVDAIAAMLVKALAPIMELIETLKGEDEVIESPEEEAIEQQIEEEIPVSLKSKTGKNGTADSRAEITMQAELAKRDDRIAKLERKEVLNNKINEAIVKLRRYGVDEKAVTKRVTDVFDKHGAKGVDLFLEAYASDRAEDPPENIEEIFGSDIDTDAELNEFAHAGANVRERAAELSALYDQSGGKAMLKVDKKDFIKDNMSADMMANQPRR
ncbi:MAG: hypothetical protein IH899_13680 [Planctomycetes bacterium]|nr:hypothetical protein [Planctomycetota bacterium]